MTNPALQWISDAYQGKYLRASFIDCQGLEHHKLSDKTPFDTAKTLSIGLRVKNVPISHFMLDETERGLLTPFQYKNKTPERIPLQLMDFELVIPEPNEWVYPKEGFNGFENDNSEAILDTGDPDQRSVLIGAGFTARCCLKETILGSFERATKRENHRVVIALNATNLHPDYHQQYRSDVLAEADDDIRDQIGFALAEEIYGALKTPTIPSRSSLSHPYTV